MATPPYRPTAAYDPVPSNRPSSLPPPPLPPVLDLPQETPNQNDDAAMDLSNPTVVVPPAANTEFRETTLDTGEGYASAPMPVVPPPEAAGDRGDGAASGGEDDDDEDDDEDEDEDDTDGEPEYPWHPIDEDKSAPCEDELKYLESKEEHSALDHAYWEKETFFDLDDADIVPGASGRIDWLVESFNGTKEKPNKELLMKSPVVQIGGLDWQIKLYPKGNRTEFLSVYLECVSIQSESFQDTIELTNPALPVLAGSPKLKKRNSIAAQVAVVMYNPAEPRVHESKLDAHQFHKKSADFGWKYFTREPRYEFHRRLHGQRQAILRDDKLAFSAYIRIVNDPTGCMWDSDGGSSDASIATTGLRPFDASSAQTAAIVSLLHLRPFRDILYKYTHDSVSLVNLQVFLEKLLARRLKRKHLRASPLPDGRDVVEVLQIIKNRLADEGEASLANEVESLLSQFTPSNIPICSNRLPIKGYTSVREITEEHIDEPLTTSPILTMELERQEFNAEKRKWEKITDKVDIDDHIEYGQQQYQLYSFVAHSGSLGSPNYIPYVRPGGPGERWYAYEPGQVHCLTQKQAMERCGAWTPTKSKDEIPPPDFPHYMHAPIMPSHDRDPVVYLVMYVREDIAKYTFALPAEEHWNIPPTVKKPPRTSPSKTGSEPNGTKPSQDPEKVNEVSVSDTAINTTAGLNAYVAEHGTLPPPTNPPPPNLMDGDDVVMSDMEEDGSSTPIHALHPFDPPPPHPATQHSQPSQPPQQAASPEAPQPAEELPTHETVVDFFASEYYAGSALSSGLYHGSGHLITASGDAYTGSFAHGHPSGTGTMVYSSTGNTYTGAFFAGLHHGAGTLTERATGNVYEGHWSEGKKHGSFVLKGTVTEEDKGLCQICWERDMNTAFYDCGHVVLCKVCAAGCETCPVCRRRVVARLELFGVRVAME